ncbi:molybdopterin-guanine dinucleotide biosynthesis protein MobA [Lacunisphaera limnophila]|uniref:Molybdopterin-guanine dinucleotide biosynthesis protein MobA n=1 Tax=Lacunisphaera limnophila TaxID=1838286 RepID=A0A1D8AZ71_9BACT|nr:molybdenum cofactor guanylyltransferase [Lacunisphaera limnophila]AOS46177.1 molybdopterin-guanine dinucleotide biosynthesis protein MobA [Lacunisphaera limnophila]
MIPANQLTGAVLAGGHSRRMGRDKATLAHEGRPLWERQAAVLRDAGCAFVGVVRQPGQAPLGLPEPVLLWHDAVADAGPLAGLHAALSSSRTLLVAVLAVDMPRIDAWWYHWLGSYCGSNIGAVACRPDGSYEPLAAIYPRTALVEATARLAGPDRSLQALAGALMTRHLLRSVPLPEGELWRVANWNTPADRVSGPDPHPESSPLA